MENESSGMGEFSDQPSPFQDESINSTLPEIKSSEPPTKQCNEVLMEEENARSGFESTDISSNYTEEETSENVVGNKPKEIIKTDFTDQKLTLNINNESQISSVVQPLEEFNGDFGNDLLSKEENSTLGTASKFEELKSGFKFDDESKSKIEGDESFLNENLKLDTDSITSSTMENLRSTIEAADAEISSEGVGLSKDFLPQINEMDMSLLGEGMEITKDSETVDDSKTCFMLQNVSGSIEMKPETNAAADKTQAASKEPKAAEARLLESVKLPMEEDSVSSFTSQKSLKRRWIEDEAANLKTSVENLFEYQWPRDQLGDYHMIQEQVSEFLGVKSFKRKYPDLIRRTVEINEREFLKEKFTLPETFCDLGLTAIRSEDVIELMAKDYPEKYQEYDRFIQEKRNQVQLAAHKNYSAPPVVDDKAKMAEIIQKAIQSTTEYNARLNQERRDERRGCVDLQTQTVHFPTGKMAKHKKTTAVQTSKYPLALIPGQFQDFYRSYAPKELRYLPLNTVVYGPPSAINVVRTADVASEDSASDSDDSSSSGDSSCSQDSHEMSAASTASSVSSKRLPETKVEEQEPEDVKVAEAKFECRVCHKFEADENVLIQCKDCKTRGHPTCLDLTDAMLNVIKTYKWQCMECKTCVHCRDPYDEDKMMFCDKCDRGYHTFCVGLRNIPSGRWICKSCGQCAVCGARTPGPVGSARAQWQNEYAKNQDGELEIVKTLCISCAKPSRKSKNAGLVSTPIVAN